jgi:glutathione S-transferase
VRGWRGLAARPGTRQPARPLELYEFEGCPFCRLVREVLTELDLDAMVLPSPHGGERFRPAVARLGGKAQFPYLVDPNTTRSMYESADIVRYLAATYGDREVGQGFLGRSLAVATSFVASATRLTRGTRARRSRPPAAPLELYSFESSPFSRLVRETLCELELPYLLRNLGKARREDMGPPWVRSTFFPKVPVEGRNRIRLHERTGRVQVPFLIDPNTKTELFESRDIIAYLERTYAL